MNSFRNRLHLSLALSVWIAVEPLLVPASLLAAAQGELHSGDSAHASAAAIERLREKHAKRSAGVDRESLLEKVKAKHAARAARAAANSDKRSSPSSPRPEPVEGPAAEPSLPPGIIEAPGELLPDSHFAYDGPARSPASGPSRSENMPAVRPLIAGHAAEPAVSSIDVDELVAPEEEKAPSSGLEPPASSLQPPTSSLLETALGGPPIRYDALRDRRRLSPTAASTVADARTTLIEGMGISPEAALAAQTWQGRQESLSPQEPVASREADESRARLAVALPVPEVKFSYLPGTIDQPIDRPLSRLSDEMGVPTTLAVETAVPIQLPLGLALEDELEPFGYDFFNIGPQPPLETAVMSVPSDYRIGPGDVLTVHVWNKLTDENFSVEINRDGRIQVPRAGELFVLGLEYGRVGDVIKAELSKYLTEVNVGVELTRLRTFQVFVTGEVKSPGAVSVNALNTTLNALLAAGGPTARGSLRKVALRRGASEVSVVDYYDLLLDGDKGADPKLQAGDVVFVPVVGDLAAIKGMVKRPAVYELLEGDSLADLIRYGGGLSPAAHPQRIALYRIKDNAFREIFDVQASGDWTGRAKQVKVRDGDVVDVPHITTELMNRVTLRGHVERPGVYQWWKGMRVRDLVQRGRRLLRGALTSRAEILRMRRLPVDMTEAGSVETKTIRELITIDLGLALTGDPVADIPICPQDDLRILNIRDAGPAPTVTITGPVNSPGEYELAAGMRVSDLVFLAGNVKEATHMGRAELVRRNPGGGYTIFQIDLQRALARDPEHDLPLKHADSLGLHFNPQLTRRIQVAITGEVRYPGIYRLHEGDRMSALIERAGGFSPDAFLPAAVFTRRSVQARQEKQKMVFVEEQRRIIQAEKATAARLPGTAKVEVDPTKFLSEAEEMVSRLASTPAGGRLNLRLQPLEILKGSDNDIEMEDGDNLAIPRPPSEISIFGEVFSPSAFVFQPGVSVTGYLARAGGFTARAWPRQTFLIRADGTTLAASQRLDSDVWDGIHLGGRNGSGEFFDVAVERGDTIFVPTDYRVKRDRTAEIIDQVYKVAVSVGALAGIFR